MTVNRPTVAGRVLDVRTPRPVVVWATLGAGIAAVEVTVFARWLASGDAIRTPTGADPVPTATQAWAVTLQVVMVLAALWAIGWVMRKCIRERRLVLDAALLIAWVSLYWQDPLMNYLRPIYLYNSALINVGSWTEQVPGWSSPNGRYLPEPLLMIGLAYVAFAMFMTIATCWVMRVAKRRWPTLGAVGLVGVAFLAMFTFDVLAELVFVRTGMYAYSGAIRSLSIWGGETYQFPVYEALLATPVFTAIGALRYFRDDRGHTGVERGVDEVRAGRRGKATLRVFALVGFVNAVLLVTYVVPMNVIALHVDETPTYPTYLRNGICGRGTRYPCPGPDVPVPLRGSAGALSPTSGLRD